MRKLLTTLCMVIFVGCSSQKEKVTLKAYVGAGLRKAIDQIAIEFQKETGVKLELDYGGSGIIISKARLDKSADLFIPGDVSYVDRLHELEGSVAEKVDLCKFTPVIITLKANPHEIKSVSDFSKKGLKVGLGKAKACRIGKVGDRLLRNYGMNREGLTSVQESLTVNELGVWVKMNSVDVSVVWDAIAYGIEDDIEIISIPEDKNVISKVVAGRLSTSSNPTAAKRFLSFLKSDRCLSILKANGYGR